MKKARLAAGAVGAAVAVFGIQKLKQSRTAKSSAPDTASTESLSLSLDAEQEPTSLGDPQDDGADPAVAYR